jgi:hypothetical protein
MVLLNHIVEVPAGPYLNVQLPRIFPSKEPLGSMTRHMAIQRHLAWPSIEICGERLAKERLCRRNATVTAKEKIDRLSLLVDRSIEVSRLNRSRLRPFVGFPWLWDFHPSIRSEVTPPNLSIRTLPATAPKATLNL